MDNFYKSFEDRHRGSRELIKSRLNFYVPIIQNVLQGTLGGKALDLGCGRGEWLELMQDIGVEAFGVDLDDGMIHCSKALGLQVEKHDVIDFIKSAPAKSYAVVTGFHIAEHLSFDNLLELIRESERVLVPGGVLILETPNPENIVVAGSGFYLDPTHNRPLPSELLSFAVGYLNFLKIKTIRLQESKDPNFFEDLTLLNVLDSVSPDYAIVAIKNGIKDGLSPNLQRLLSQDYGYSLHDLAAKYDANLMAKIGSLESRVSDCERKLNLIASIFKPILWLRRKLNGKVSR